MNLVITTDNNKDEDKSKVEFEFELPIHEISENVIEGEVGKLLLPVEVIRVYDGMVTFKKVGQASAPNQFHKKTTTFNGAWTHAGRKPA